jgi:hypothetical protein
LVILEFKAHQMRKSAAGIRANINRWLDQAAKLGNHARDEDHKTRKHYVLEVWLADPVGFDPVIVADKLTAKRRHFGANPLTESERATIRTWHSKWTNYRGNKFSMFPQGSENRIEEIKAAIALANGLTTASNFTTKKVTRKLDAAQRQGGPQHTIPKAIDLERPPKRITSTEERIVRDTKLSLEVKTIHGYRCQIKDCRTKIRLPDGQCYAEAHHIKPLGRDHCGPDVSENILCVCPNHHAELDLGILFIKRSRLRQAPSHKVSDKFINYHNRIVQTRLGSRT